MKYLATILLIVFFFLFGYFLYKKRILFFVKKCGCGCSEKKEKHDTCGKINTGVMEEVVVIKKQEPIIAIQKKKDDFISLFAEC